MGSRENVCQDPEFSKAHCQSAPSSLVLPVGVDPYLDQLLNSFVATTKLAVWVRTDHVVWMCEVQGCWTVARSVLFLGSRRISKGFGA